MLLLLGGAEVNPGDISTSFPSLEIDISGGYALDASFPSLGISLDLGGFIDVDFPQLNLEIQNLVIGNIDGALPSLWYISDGSVGYELETFNVEFPVFESNFAGGSFIEAEFSGLQLSSIGSVANLGNLSTSFPELSLQAHTGG